MHTYAHTDAARDVGPCTSAMCRKGPPACAQAPRRGTESTEMVRPLSGLVNPPSPIGQRPGWQKAGHRPGLPLGEAVCRDEQQPGGGAKSFIHGFPQGGSRASVSLAGLNRSQNCRVCTCAENPVVSSVSQAAGIPTGSPRFFWAPPHPGEAGRKGRGAQSNLGGGLGRQSQPLPTLSPAPLNGGAREKGLLLAPPQRSPPCRPLLASGPPREERLGGTREKHWPDPLRFRGSRTAPLLAPPCSSGQRKS